MRIRERSTAVRSRRKGAGQSVVEFALILPIMLTLFGGAVDFSRVYSAYINVQEATRNAAESIATDKTISTDPAATTEAQRLVCLEIVGTSPCTGPKMPVATVPSPPCGSSAGTLCVVTLKVVQPFDMLFPYPF
ncbi:MAG TPA: TadE/TadG family type IV pilus assembly protein, partial [Candidatus Limnocylindrales bacterium]